MCKGYIHAYEIDYEKEQKGGFCAKYVQSASIEEKSNNIISLVPFAFSVIRVMGLIFCKNK